MGGDDKAVLTAVTSLHEKIDGNSKETHRRIDGLVESVGGVQASVTGMTVSLNIVKKDVNGHLKDHKQENIEVVKERRRAGWGIIETVIGAVLTLCIVILIYKMGWG